MGADRGGLGAATTARAGCGWSATAPATASRAASPAPTSTRTSPSPGVIAAGLHGIEHELDPGPAFEGNAYEDPDVARIPSTLVEAIDLFEHSEVARAAFGDDVHHHLLNTAQQEWRVVNRAVTDWELRRGFERL